MAAIKGKNTKPEVAIRKMLRALGYRYRLHVKKLPGKPDIVIQGRKTVVLINGCFWHQHRHCRYASMPKSNVPFWREKLQRNVNRDKENIGLLKKKGYKVILIWECQIKKMMKTGSNTINSKLIGI